MLMLLHVCQMCEQATVCKHVHHNNFKRSLYVDVVFIMCCAAPKWPKKLVNEVLTEV